MTVIAGGVEILRMIPARPLDEHGWADPNPLKPADPIWGNIQERIPGPQPDGDFGIWEPGQARKAVGYFDVQVNPGDVLKFDDVIWRVQDCRLVRDPRGKKELDCWVSQLEEVTKVQM